MDEEDVVHPGIIKYAEGDEQVDGILQTYYAITCYRNDYELVEISVPQYKIVRVPNNDYAEQLNALKYDIEHQYDKIMRFIELHEEMRRDEEEWRFQQALHKQMGRASDADTAGS